MKQKTLKGKFLPVFGLIMMLVLCSNLQAQTYTNINTYGYRWHRGYFDSSFRIPYGNTPVFGSIGSSVGAIFYNTTDSSVYVNTGIQWIQLGGSGGGASYFAGYGLNLSSAIFEVDTTLISTRLWRQKGIDSINTYISANYYSKLNINSFFGGTTPIGGYNKNQWDAMYAAFAAAQALSPSGWSTQSALVDTAAAIRGSITAIPGVGDMEKADYDTDNNLVVDSATGAANASNLGGVAASSYVQNTRSINTGLWLSGGGNLSANRTLIADSSAIAAYLLRRKDSVAGGYYPYSSNPLGYLTSASIAGKQDALSGTGFVKISGTTISYDNSTYVPTTRTINGNALSSNITLSTSDIAEGTNLYWTNGRFDTRLAANIPLSADATTNKYLNWNGSAYTRKQIDYSEIASTPSLAGYELLSNKVTSLASPNNTTYPTSLAVSNAIAAAGGGDMLKSVYDANNDGIVSNSELLNGNTQAFFLARANHTGSQAQSTITDLVTDLAAKVPNTRTINGQALSSNITLNTDNIAEGSTNQYWTNARFDTRFGTKTTDNLTEGSTNLYYTNARARGAISLTTTGSGAATYNNSTGVLNIPTPSGTPYTFTASDFNESGTTVSIDYTNGQAASGSTKGFLNSTDWTTFNSKQPQLNGTGFVKASGTTISYDNSTYLTGNQTITLSGDVSGSGTTAITTTIGTNAVTLGKIAQIGTGLFLGRTTAGTGNVEALTGSQVLTGIGAVPTSRTLTINGTAYDLSANRSWTVGTAINDIGDATGAGVVAVGNNNQNWQFDGLTGSGFQITGNTTAATSFLHKLFRAQTTGANASSGITTQAAEISNSHTGTNSTNRALVVSAINGTNNYALLVPANSGKVGIGTDAPDSILHIVGGVKIVNGTQGAGKVFTSDANGGASWQTPSGGTTETLDQTLAAGQTSTRSILLDNYIDATNIYIKQSGVDYGSLGASTINSIATPTLTIKDSASTNMAYLYSNGLSANHYYKLLPSNTTYDTVATRAYARSFGGVGSSAIASMINDSLTVIRAKYDSAFKSPVLSMPDSSGFRLQTFGGWQDSVINATAAGSSSTTMEEKVVVTSSTSYAITSTDVNVIYTGASGATLTLGVPSYNRVLFITNTTGNTVNVSENLYITTSSNTLSIAPNSNIKIVYSTADSKWYRIYQND